MSTAPESEVRLIAQWCADQWPERLRNEVFWEAHVRGAAVTVCETRAPWDGTGDWTHAPLAQLRFRSTSGDWALYWADSNDRWHPFEPDGTHVTGSATALLEEIDEDRTSIFKG